MFTSCKDFSLRMEKNNQPSHVGNAVGDNKKKNIWKMNFNPSDTVFFL